MQNVFDTKAFNIWSKDRNLSEGDWKAAGVAAPVFSLKSKESFGIGEFLDLEYLADWCEKVGMKIIQILPINDTSTDNSWDNSYPYKAISTKALHPIYLRLSAMGTLDDKDEIEYFDSQKNILNDKDFVDYPEVMKIKNEYFRKIFVKTWNETKSQEDYKAFFKENEEWLVPYAAFRHLSSKFGTSDFSQWEGLSVFNKNKIETLSKETKDAAEIEFHYFLQYHLDKQLKEAVNYLHDKGIALKGDIPIGIGRHSVEAWTNPELFNLDSQAGAPPDAFATEGQNWGFPTYNWEVMAQDNYKWWRERLRQMSRYFDAYRIDHILGFFRIWEIPQEHTQGLMGHFSPALPLSSNEYKDRFEIEKYSTPYINKHYLNYFFGEYAHEVRDKYLCSCDSYNNTLTLKEEFDSQRKIETYFSKHHNELSEKDYKIKDGLLRLCAEVLFLKDKKDSSKFHPRIALQFTQTYNELEDYKKDEINKIYDDFFYHRNEELWREEAMKKLPAIIEASDMLVCAEDLGMVPACVKEVMEKLKILSLEVQRMPKQYGETFVDPAKNPYLSVDTTSTHDTSTLRGWWEENGELTNRFYREMLGHDGGAPYFAEPYICKEIIKLHLDSSSMLTILPIQDYIAMDGNFRWNATQREQINIPSNPNHHWCYKMHQSLESLNERQDFNDMLNYMIKESKRD